MYRASSIYSVPLSLGEFTAMIIPLGYYFIFHRQGLRERLLGYAVAVTGCLACFLQRPRRLYRAYRRERRCLAHCGW